MAILNPGFHNAGRMFAGRSDFILKLAMCSLAISAVFFTNAARAQTVSPEYKLKAIFLFNFVQFVDWPSNTFSNEKSPIVIGVLGTNPFGKALEETVRDETVRNRPLEVRYHKTVQEITNCHVLFVSSSEKPRLDSTLASLKGRSILTVSDIEEFANRGGMISFIKEKNKIRFRINVDAVKADDLSISSKLLQLAEIVSEKSGR